MTSLSNPTEPWCLRVGDLNLPFCWSLPTAHKLVAEGLEALDPSTHAQDDLPCDSIWPERLIPRAKGAMVLKSFQERFFPTHLIKRTRITLSSIGETVPPIEADFDKWLTCRKKQWHILRENRRKMRQRDDENTHTHTNTLMNAEQHINTSEKPDVKKSKKQKTGVQKKASKKDVNSASIENAEKPKRGRPRKNPLVPKDSSADLSHMQDASGSSLPGDQSSKFTTSTSETAPLRKFAPTFQLGSSSGGSVTHDDMHVHVHVDREETEHGIEAHVYGREEESHDNVIGGDGNFARKSAHMDDFDDTGGDREHTNKRKSFGPSYMSAFNEHECPEGDFSAWLQARHVTWRKSRENRKVAKENARVAKEDARVTPEKDFYAWMGVRKSYWAAHREVLREKRGLPIRQSAWDTSTHASSAVPKKRQKKTHAQNSPPNT